MRGRHSGQGHFQAGWGYLVSMCVCVFCSVGIGTLQPEVLAPSRAGAVGTGGCRLAWAGGGICLQSIARQLGSHWTWRSQQVVSWRASQVPGSLEAPHLPLGAWMLSSVTRDTETSPVPLQPAKTRSKVVSFSVVPVLLEMKSSTQQLGQAGA